MNKLMKIVKDILLMTACILLGLVGVWIAGYMASSILAMIIALIRPDLPVDRVIEIAGGVVLAVFVATGTAIVTSKPLDTTEHDPLIKTIGKRIKERKERKK